MKQLIFRSSIRRPRAGRLLLALLVALSLALPPRFAAAASGSAPGDIAVYLEGARLTSDVPPYIVPKLNLTMVPLRVIGEGLGAAVDWTPAARTVTIRQADTLITLRSGQTTAVVDGAQVKLDGAAQVVSGRVMVPLRFVGESLGLTVAWNPAARSISLHDPDVAEPDTGSDPGTGPSGPGTNPGGGTGDPGADPGSGTAGLRGAWISTVYNLDWPSAASAGNADKQKAEFVQLLDDLQGMGLNAVFVQLRAAGDAFYPSALAPWSKYLTGTQGKGPTYDPLAFMIAETHKRGMEFHAWFNPFRAGLDAKTDGLAPNHVMLQHPEWIVLSGGKPYLNPGLPDARRHIIDAILDAVKGYDIDGVHLDDYFYPSSGQFPDAAAYAANNPLNLKLADWRRANINAFVSDLGQAVHAAKPGVRFGISPFGVWRNNNVDPTGSPTRAGVTDYDNMYADVRTWIKNGWIDYVAPQLYWSFDTLSAPYGKLVDWWSNEVRGTDVDLYIGHSPYKLGTPEAGWQSANEIIRQLDYGKSRPEVDGDVFFSAKDLRANPLGIQDALRGYYAAGN
ncbi:family 10 glycosylhydrolase [Paenibacillus sp. MWE-103]|uniref:Family 10 glycosylhydrolase n=1 Tax=Paenibacillus artemisiicola TaxID=1172618 RepID=A0ABS3WDJ0_9BACL|nr:family 10 glycosylhydrolase [Paenibacillus artemisiicola]MBO7746376.1 family 10 glycosylhydrolase [Paenibacillus artemisiicola]